jgi:hypothetical protein
MNETEAREYNMDKIEETYHENSWRECLTFMPMNPVKMFKILHPNRRLPMTAYEEGYTENDDSFVESYGRFEEQNLSDQLTSITRDYERDIAAKKLLIKNNIFIDKQSSRIGTINRVEMNFSDGYYQNTIIAGKVSDKDKNQYDSWFSDEQLLSGKELVCVKPQIYANKTFGMGFGKEQIGSPQYFFEARDDFIDAFQDDPISQADALIVDDAVNPEFIGFETRLTGVQAFDNIMAYSKATGMPTFADMCSFTIQINYFCHEVLNVLMPKQIVLIMDTYRGLIDIPHACYIPNIQDPVLNIPDYNNRMWHIVELMKIIAQKGMFKPYVGNAYIKLSITPAIFVLNFISEYAPSVRLMMAMGTVDNQVLYDVENTNGIFPEKYYSRSMYNRDGGVITTLGENYYDKLINLPGDMISSKYVSRHTNYDAPPTIYPAQHQYSPYQPNQPLFGWYE